MPVLFQDPSPPEREVFGRRLIEYTDAEAPEMRERRVEIVNLDGDDNIAVNKLAFAREFNELNDRSIARIEKSTTQLKLGHMFYNWCPQTGGLAIKFDAVLKIVDDDGDVIELVCHVKTVSVIMLIVRYNPICYDGNMQAEHLGRQSYIIAIVWEGKHEDSRGLQDALPYRILLASR
jgi:hypothetical protein